jgi:hypothetical protein
LFTGLERDILERARIDYSDNDVTVSSAGQRIDLGEMDQVENSVRKGVVRPL